MNVDPEVVLGISFHGCELSQLPDEIEEYYNTRHFFLGDNHLTKVPDILQSFDALEGLYLFDNSSIKTLPEWLRHRTELRVLQLSGIDHLTVPKWILELPDLDLIRFPHGEPDWFREHPRHDEINIDAYIMDIQ
jgi:hypothetical protein